MRNTSRESLTAAGPGVTKSTPTSFPGTLFSASLGTTKGGREERPWERGLINSLVTTSRFLHLEKLSLNFSSSSFIICVNLLHPQASLFPRGLLLSFWCFSILVNFYFQVSFNLKVVLCAAKITQNTVTKLVEVSVHKKKSNSFYPTIFAAAACCTNKGRGAWS